MESMIKLSDELLKRLQNKSIETGISPNKIVNDLVNDGLEQYHSIPVKNNPTKTISLDSILGIVVDDCELNSVELKRELYK